MSTFQAIAGVTEALRRLLLDGMANLDFGVPLGTVHVTALPPSEAASKLGTEDSSLNVFLYRTVPNQGWRNVDLPSRDRSGAATANPPLALDLWYLVSAYSSQHLGAEIMLGYAMDVFHRQPTLDRAALRRVAPGSAPNVVALSRIGDQIEVLKITPEPMSLEEQSHLWSNLQAGYRPSVAYAVSVVLIEHAVPVRIAPPVRQLVARALPLRRPSLQGLASAPAGSDAALAIDQLERPITSGDRLFLRGENLRGEATVVLLDGRPLATGPVVPDDREIAFDLPAGLAAGLHGLQVDHQLLLGMPPQPHTGATSNLLAFVLRPVVTGVALVSRSGAGAAIALTVDPPVGRRQRLTVIVEPIAGGPARGFAIPARSMVPGEPDRDASLVVSLEAVPAGIYRVRIDVDGATSVATPSRPDPQVTVP